MERFIKKISLFLLPIILIGVSLEIALRSIPNDYKVKNHYMETNAHQIHTLILGSSHAFRGINPRYFDGKGYNIAYISQTLDLDFQIFEKYKRKLVNLKNLIIPISYFTYYNQLKNGKESWRVKNYFIYYGIDANSKLSQYFEILSSNFRINIKRLLGQIFNARTLTVDKLGFGPFEEKHKLEINWKEDGRIAAERHTARTAIHVQENLNYLDEIIKYCELKNVKVLLVSIPVYETYIDSIDSKQYLATIKMSDSIANAHNNTIYINKLEDESFSQKDFYNSDHLNQGGSKKLSLYLSKQLQ